MKWRGRARSSNIDDRRGQRRSRRGGRMRMPRGGKLSAGSLGVLAVVFVAALALGINPMELLEGTVLLEPSSSQTTTRTRTSAANDELAQFVGVVVKETENVWGQVFAANGLSYEAPVIVLYRGQTRSACGVADARTGPFYCPGDQQVYIDLGFYQQLRKQFGAPGDFAQAYVLAHEIGHHVQQLTGVLPEFNQARGGLSKDEANAWSVRVELQADCYAGVWAASAGQEDLLERGDIEEALNAANQIGDDTLQKRMQGYAVPKTFSHGSSAQRKRWFKRGFDSGSAGSCDTFESAGI